MMGAGTELLPISSHFSGQEPSKTTILEKKITIHRVWCKEIEAKQDNFRQKTFIIHSD